MHIYIYIYIYVEAKLLPHTHTHIYIYHIQAKCLPHTHTHTHTHTHKMEYCLVIKRNKILPLTAAQMNSEGIMASEISQRYCLILHDIIYR